MNAITISKARVAKEKGVVVLPMKEYERLARAAVPEIYLTGKAAEDLDKLVEEGLREYAAGRTHTAKSLSDAVRQHRKRNARRRIQR